MTESDGILKMVVRIIAALLGTGGCLWGAFCLVALIAFGFPLLGVLWFVPGYVVTAGYLLRAISAPSPGICCVIWVLSLLVQGVWLSVFVASRLTAGRL